MTYDTTKVLRCLPAGPDRLLFWLPDFRMRLMGIGRNRTLPGVSVSLHQSLLRQ